MQEVPFILMGADDYILVGHSDTLEFGTGDFTISFWARTTFTSPQMVVHKGTQRD